MATRDSKKRILLLALVMAVAGILLVFLSVWPGGRVPAKPAADFEPTPEIEIRSPLYTDLSGAAFTDAQGDKRGLSNACSTVLLYWASWCPDCEAIMPDVDAAAKLVRDAGADFYLVDRLEPERESVESALGALSEAGVSSQTLFDEGRVIYDAIGLSMIPSLVVVDKDGLVTAVFPGGIPEKNALLSMIDEADTGKTQSLCTFIQREMMDGDGGVHTEYVSSGGESPSGTDVLSESQGLFMLVAQDGLFERLYDYTIKHTAGGSLCAWVVTGEGDSTANASIDDLRIVRALSQNGLDISQYAEFLYEYNVSDERLVDFYDFESGAADRLTLCYADFEALHILAGVDPRFSAVYANALEAVKNGYISDAFPLYYSWLDYSRNVYPGDELNMAQGFTTLLHLSRVGQLPAQTLNWIRARAEEGRIWAAYTADGKPAARYESTAVYGLAAMTALSAGDNELAAALIGLMEKQKLRDASNVADCAFGNADGTGMRSFDQLIAANAYREMDRAAGRGDAD